MALCILARGQGHPRGDHLCATWGAIRCRRCSRSQVAGNLSQHSVFGGQGQREPRSETRLSFEVLTLIGCCTNMTDPHESPVVCSFCEWRMELRRLQGWPRLDGDAPVLRQTHAGDLYRQTRSHPPTTSSRRW